jgi:hypothetical protein
MEKESITKGWMENMLTAMIALLAISTAGTAYLSHMEGSESTDNYFRSQSILVEANSLFLEANQAIIYDYSMYDGYYLAEAEGDTNTSDYYYASMSIELKDSLDREEGPFDDQYYQEIYQLPNEVYENGTMIAGVASEQNTASDGYQLAVLISAVGLSLTGWAALMGSKRLKLTFFACSVLCLTFTTIQTLSV